MLMPPPLPPFRERRWHALGMTVGFRVQIIRNTPSPFTHKCVQGTSHCNRGGSNKVNTCLPSLRGGTIGVDIYFDFLPLRFVPFVLLTSLSTSPATWEARVWLIIVNTLPPRKARHLPSGRGGTVGVNVYFDFFPLRSVPFALLTSLSTSPP